MTHFDLIFVFVFDLFTIIFNGIDSYGSFLELVYPLFRELGDRTSDIMETC